MSGLIPTRGSTLFSHNKDVKRRKLYTTGYFLQNRTDFKLEDKLLPVYNVASSGLKKMFDLIILYTHKSVSENVCPVTLFWTSKKKKNYVSCVGM